MRPPPELERFVALFGEGRHWDSHEVLEGPWKESGSGFYHGLILYASAFVHHERGNRHGVDAQLRKAIEALGPFRPYYLGVDVETLLAHADRVRKRVAAEGDEAGEGAEWTREVGPPALELDPGRVRGDEPELRTPGR